MNRAFRFDRAVDSALVGRKGQSMRMVADFDFTDDFLAIEIDHAEAIARGVSHVKFLSDSLVRCDAGRDQPQSQDRG